MINFSNEKNGYNKQEVEKYINNLVSETDREILQYKKNINELEKQLVIFKKSEQELNERRDKLSSIISMAVDNAESSKNLYRLRVQQFNILYPRFKTLFLSLMQKYPQLENIPEVKSAFEEFINVVEIASLDVDAMDVNSSVSSDNDSIRRLLSKLSKTEKQAIISNQQAGIKVVKIKRKTESKQLKDILNEKSNIKPIADLELEGHDSYDTLAEKFLDMQKSEDIIFSKLLSKNNTLTPNESGFDLKEAVNPTEDLEEIMRAFNFYNPS